MDDDADPPALPPSGEQHGHPEEGMECLATMEDITTEDGNYCEYQTAPRYVDTCDTCAVPQQGGAGQLSPWGHCRTCAVRVPASVPYVSRAVRCTTAYSAPVAP